MANVLKRTLLWRQIQEVCAERAAVRRREYRYALKTKRLLVKMKVLGEVQRLQVENIAAHLTAIEGAAHITAARNLAEAHNKRWQAVESYAASKGASLPVQKGVNVSEDFKQKMMERLSKRVPSSVRGLAAGPIVDGVLKTSFQNAQVDPKAGPEKMSVDLAVSMANEAGISKAELEEMLRSIEDPNEKDASDFLRDNILPRIRERDDNAPRGLAAAYEKPLSSESSVSNSL